MKLLNDYRLRFENRMVLYLLPLVFYFYIFKETVYDLVAGGIMFVYLTMITAFINRYFRTIIHYWLCEFKGYGGRLKLKAWHPRSYPEKTISSKETRKLEFLTILVTYMISFLIWISVGILSPHTYLYDVVTGHLILSTMIFYKEYRYINLSFIYPNHSFEYNDRTVKIYERQEV